MGLPQQASDVLGEEEIRCWECVRTAGSGMDFALRDFRIPLLRKKLSKIQVFSKLLYGKRKFRVSRQSINRVTIHSGFPGHERTLLQGMGHSGPATGCRIS